jgi:hypothetical protein
MIENIAFLLGGNTNLFRDMLLLLIIAGGSSLYDNTP